MHAEQRPYRSPLSAHCELWAARTSMYGRASNSGHSVHVTQCQRPVTAADSALHMRAHLREARELAERVAVHAAVQVLDP